MTTNTNKEMTDEIVNKEEKIANEIIYFNKHYKTNYTKEQIAQIYWLGDCYEMTTTSAIQFCNNCHLCGDKLPVFGSEFCCNGHIFEFMLRLQMQNCVRSCAWGKSCKFCLKNSDKKEGKEEKEEE